MTIAMPYQVLETDEAAAGSSDAPLGKLSEEQIKRGQVSTTVLYFCNHYDHYHLYYPMTVLRGQIKKGEVAAEMRSQHTTWWHSTWRGAKGSSSLRNNV